MMISSIRRRRRHDVVRTLQIFWMISMTIETCHSLWTGVNSFTLRSNFNSDFRRADTLVRKLSETSGVELEPLLGISEPVEVIKEGPLYAVINKPGSVKCHYSEWTGKTNEVPMLQRVRDTLQRRVNLIHRLDRGASGCLLVALSSEGKEDCDQLRTATKLLSDALQSPDAIKTYVAITRGEGILRGEDLKEKSYFVVDRPIKDENGIENSATTMFNFVGGVNRASDGVRASIVIAKPSTGRWHQIRRHLNGLSHPILGDSSHGNSRTNREWRDRGLPNERFCLHLARIQVPATELTDQIDVTCPLPKDMSMIINKYLPDVLSETRSLLESEGIIIEQEKINGNV